jgi:hypothetical protein
MEMPHALLLVLSSKCTLVLGAVPLLSVLHPFLMIRSKLKYLLSPWLSGPNLPAPLIHKFTEMISRRCENVQVINKKYIA